MSVAMFEDRFAAEPRLPLLLRVEEAASLLRIGRTLAYSLAHRYEESGGTDGLPVIRLGNCLRVPRWALIELARTGRVVALSELSAHTAGLLGRLDDEASVVPSESAHQAPAVEQHSAPKSKRPKRPLSAAGRVGQQLVLLPSD